MKKGLIFKGLTMVILSVFFLVSCGLPPPGTPLTPEQREQAKNSCIAQYTMGGAVLGGITGALLGGKDKVKGAVLGAMTGSAIALLLAYGKCLAYFSDLTTFPVADYKETKKREGYRANLGEVVKIKEFSLPKEAKPGDKLKITGSYYVMAPNELKDVKVKEIRTIYYYDTSEKTWKELGPIQNEVTTELGTRKADGYLEILKDQPEGKYRLDFKVEALGKSDLASSEFVVKKPSMMGKIWSMLNF